MQSLGETIRERMHSPEFSALQEQLGEKLQQGAASAGAAVKKGYRSFMKAPLQNTNKAVKAGAEFAGGALGGGFGAGLGGGGTFGVGTVAGGLAGGAAGMAVGRGLHKISPINVAAKISAKISKKKGQELKRVQVQQKQNIPEVPKAPSTM